MRLAYLGLILSVCLGMSGCFLKSKIRLPEKNYAEMTLDEIKNHLRKGYGFFECPQKSDRLLITEEIWQQIDWTEEEKYRNAALPHKMWNMRHDDHGWPHCTEWRGDDARGPRAGYGHPKYFPPLPKLVKGRGIARWMSRGDLSVLEIPLFKDFKTEWTEDLIPLTLEVTERRHGNPQDGQTFTITKEYLLENYAPSPLQKFSNRSYLETFPTHRSYHIMFNKTEDVYGNGPDDSVYFWRTGWRWDSYDDYYVEGAKYIGGHWN